MNLNANKKLNFFIKQFFFGKKLMRINFSYLSFNFRLLRINLKIIFICQEGFGMIRKKKSRKRRKVLYIFPNFDIVSSIHNSNRVERLEDLQKKRSNHNSLIVDRFIYIFGYFTHTIIDLHPKPRDSVWFMCTQKKSMISMLENDIMVQMYQINFRVEIFLLLS